MNQATGGGSGRSQVPSTRAKSPRSSHGETNLPKPSSAMSKRAEGLGERLPFLPMALSRPETANTAIGIPPKKGMNLEEALLQKETEQKQKREKERLEKMEHEMREKIKGKRNLERSTSLMSFVELQNVESSNELSAAKIVITADGQIECWSDNCENLLGWNSQEVSSKEIWDIIPEIKNFIPHLQRCAECEDDTSEEATPTSKKRIFWTLSLESLFLDKNKRCTGYHKEFGLMECEMHIRPIRLENGLRFAVNVREFPVTTEAFLTTSEASQTQKKSDGGGAVDMDLLASKLTEELLKGAIS